MLLPVPGGREMFFCRETQEALHVGNTHDLHSSPPMNSHHRKSAIRVDF